MLKIADVLRLSEDGTLTRKEISLGTGVSTGTVSNILARAAASGVSWPLPDGVAIEELRRLLYPPSETANAVYLEPELPALAQVLMDQKTRRGYRTPRVTREVLWEEYCAEAAAQGLKGYSRSRFFELLKGHLKGPGQEPEMRFNYEPGVWMMSDFSGKTLPLQTRDGHKMVEILVCVLPCSGLIFATAVADQTLASWTGAHRGDKVVTRRCRAQQNLCRLCPVLWHRSAPCPADAARADARQIRADSPSSVSGKSVKYVGTSMLGEKAADLIAGREPLAPEYTPFHRASDWQTTQR